MINCLSIQQPWAWYVASGRKPWENRSWPTHVRGPVLIHAGKSRERLGDADVKRYGERPSDRDLAFGAIIGLGEIAGCFTKEGALSVEPAYAVWVEGPQCFRFVQCRLFDTPIPYRGERGFFKVPITAVEHMLTGPELHLVKAAASPPSAR